MKEAVPETYILPVPGSEETQELSRSVVLEKMARGEIKQTDWIWSPPDQDWKTVAEIPSLQPAQKKSFLGGSLGPVGPKQKIEPITAPVIGLPPAPKKKKVKPRRTKSEDDDEPSRFGLFLSAMIVLLFAVVIVNYQFVDRPFDGSLAQTQFVLVPAHAHLGAFIQRDQLIIHVLPTNELNSDNFADFLFTLASCTPPPPFGATDFNVIELTPGWRGQFAFIGDDWRQLAKMTSRTSRDRKDFILEHIDNASGQKLVAATDQAGRDQAWQNLVATFHAEGNPADEGWVTSIGGMISSWVSKVMDLIPHGGSSTPPDSSNPAGGSADSGTPATGSVVSAPGLFTYTAPAGWTIKNLTLSKYPIAYGPDVNGFAPNIIVSLNPFSEPLDKIASILKDNISQFSTPLVHNIQYVSQSPFVTNSGVNGIRVTLSAAVSDSNVPITEEMYLFRAPNCTLQVMGTGAANMATTDSPVFDSCVKTLTIP